MKIARILLAAAVVSVAAACSSDPTGIADRAAPQAPRNATSAASQGFILGTVPTIPGVTETVNNVIDVPCVLTEVIVNGIRTTVLVCGDEDGGAWMGGGQ
jgi:hypothetical protein